MKILISIIYWIFISFGIFAGIFFLFHGIRKITKGELSFKGRRLFKYLNELKATSVDDFSGSELLLVGVIQINNCGYNFLPDEFSYFLANIHKIAESMINSPGYSRHGGGFSVCA